MARGAEESTDQFARGAEESAKIALQELLLAGLQPRAPIASHAPMRSEARPMESSARTLARAPAHKEDVPHAGTHEAAGARWRCYGRVIDRRAARLAFSQLQTFVAPRVAVLRDMWGQKVLEPRLKQWMTPFARVHPLRSSMRDCDAWPDALNLLAEAAWRHTGECFDVALVNYYRNGQDCIDAHSDKPPDCVICSVSLGATRSFVIRRREERHGRIEEKIVARLALEDGTMLCMSAAMQRTHTHEIPREPAVSAPRINVTFRQWNAPLLTALRAVASVLDPAAADTHRDVQRLLCPLFFRAVYLCIVYLADEPFCSALT